MDAARLGACVGQHHRADEVDAANHRVSASRSPRLPGRSQVLPSSIRCTVGKARRMRTGLPSDEPLSTTISSLSGKLGHEDDAGILTCGKPSWLTTTALTPPRPASPPRIEPAPAHGPAPNRFQMIGQPEREHHDVVGLA